MPSLSVSTGACNDLKAGHALIVKLYSVPCGKPPCTSVNFPVLVLTSLIILSSSVSRLRLAPADLNTDSNQQACHSITLDSVCQSMYSFYQYRFPHFLCQYPASYLQKHLLLHPHNFHLRTIYQMEYLELFSMG